MKKILVSACLAGKRCRYNAENKPNENVIALKEKYDLILVCPEVLGGLETPRSPAEIRGKKVISKDGKDVTEMFETGAKKTLEIAKQNKCRAAVFKSKSPSCGKNIIYDGSFSGKLTSGDGICTKLLEENNIFVLDENHISELDKFFD